MNILEKIESRQFNPGDYVAHFKHVNLTDNNPTPLKYLYQIIAIARDSNNPSEAYVVYRQLHSYGEFNEDDISWSRPYKEFISEITPYKYFNNIVSRYGCKVKVFIGEDIEDDKDIISEYPHQCKYDLETGQKAFVYSDIFLNFEQIEMCIRRRIVKDDDLAESRMKKYSELFKNYSTQYRFTKVSESYVKRCSEREFALQESKLMAKLDKIE